MNKVHQSACTIGDDVAMYIVQSPSGSTETIEHRNAFLEAI